jgi:DHA2 family methylenomycin A resistance protein-like MFS transporter
VGDATSPRGADAALAVAVHGFVVVTRDALVVNVALPSTGRERGGGITGPQGAVDGYTSVFAALLLLATAVASLSLRPAPSR